MSHSAAIWAHIQTALLLLLPLCLLPETLRHTRIVRTGTPLMVFVVALMPLEVPNPGAFLYAYAGALSIPTLSLLAALASRRLWALEILPQRDWRALLSGAAAAGLLLYPMALGLGPFDPYTLGFAGPLLPLLLAATIATAWWCGLHATAVVLLAVLWGWLTALGESQNLWDYLLDPWLWIYALAWVTTRIVR